MRLTWNEAAERDHRDNDLLLPRREAFVDVLMLSLLGLQERGRLLDTTRR